jgi:hypothetical protein
MCLYWKKSLEIFFSRIGWQISIKLDTNHPCIKGIEVYINRGPGHLQRGDNCKNSNLFFIMEHKARKTQVYIKAI